ncbi:Yip1 family protein [Kushneria phosphatilytica]|nr:Yip1 family protein [Kushneria phosphatilytica]
MMMQHVWGLLAHPGREWQQIRGEAESETIAQHYTRHVLLLAAIPVICSWIGTTQFGWNFGEGKAVTVSPVTAFYLAIVFYIMLLAAVALMGSVLHWLAHRFPHRPSRRRCIIFAGYIATPMFLSGIVAIYPLIWLCLLAGTIGLCYTGWLLYQGVPGFFSVNARDAGIVSVSTLGIGVLVLEALLAATVVLWGYGPDLF